MQASIGSSQNIQSALRCLRQSDWPGAAKFLEKELFANPSNPEALHLMGIAAHQVGLFESALGFLEKAIRLSPRDPRYYNDCGETYRKMGKLSAAIARYRRALSLDPQFYPAQNNLGSAFLEEGKIQQAIHCFRHVLSEDSKNPDAHWNLSLALLMSGNFKEGWDEYEWRFESTQKKLKRSFRQPRWDGGDLSEKTILILYEQGLGDALHFIRYIPLIQKERNGNVILERRPELARLFKNIPDISFVEMGATPASFDFYLPIMSLPRVFTTDEGTIPNQMPYLSVDPELARRWKNKIGNSSKLKVGITWSGNKNHVNDRNRSCPLETFRPLWDVAGVEFYSLQKNEAEPSFVSDMPLIDLCADIEDFADTAALIKALDLVISVDTAVVHLAGAIAKPVWTLLPFTPDWRWLLAREDSPWYPTMRLFRQPVPGDWRSVMRQAADELAVLSKSGLRERKLA
jgi:cytochrome c-type biogenesis protein CcmH/NrfG